MSDPFEMLKGEDLCVPEEESDCGNASMLLASVAGNVRGQARAIKKKEDITTLLPTFLPTFI